MDRKRVKKFLTYGTLQALVENTLLKIPSLKNADMAELKTHVFNGLLARAKQKQISFK